MPIDPANQKKNRPWLRAALRGSAAALGVLALSDFILGFIDGYLVLGFLEGMRSGSEPVHPPSGGTSNWGFLLLWIVLSIVGTIVFKRFREVREEAEHQRRSAELARDAALRTKLAPHFIFNALNTLHAQIEGDPRGAQATTERLAQLFRQVLDASDRSTVPLREELDFVEGYLGIEQARLGDRLRVQIDVPEDMESLDIPPLSLQVLVENAVKHGVASQEAGGLVRVEARQEEGILSLSVTDPGNGQGVGEGTGTALATLRARLARPEDLELAVVDEGFSATFRWRQA